MRGLVSLQKGPPESSPPLLPREDTGEDAIYDPGSWLHQTLHLPVLGLPASKTARNKYLLFVVLSQQPELRRYVYTS